MQDQDRIRRALAELGIELPEGCEGQPTKLVVVQATMEDARAMLTGARDQTVMARVDQQTADDLDAWVEVGIAKSRSEAAAMFLREGLNLRKQELAQMSEALAEVRRAQEQLRAQARQVLGTGASDSLGDED